MSSQDPGFSTCLVRFLSHGALLEYETSGKGFKKGSFKYFLKLIVFMKKKDPENLAIQVQFLGIQAFSEPGVNGNRLIIVKIINRRKFRKFKNSDFEK